MELPFIYQTLAENSENNDTAKTFILSGWFLDYTGVDKGYVSDKFYQSTGVLQTDLTEGTLKISKQLYGIRRMVFVHIPDLRVNI